MAAPRTPITTTMTAEPGRGAGALYRLLAWLSPSFPVGAFSYSHGLEAAAASGMVHDRASLEAWIAAIVVQGSGRIDADILCEAYRAARAGDEAGIDAANRRGLAFRGTAELALEAAQQGEAFLSAWRNAWSDPHPPAANTAGSPSPPGASQMRRSDGRELCSRQTGRERDLNGAAPLSRTAGEGAGARSATAGEGVCHSAVFGMAAARAGIALDDALLGYLQAFAANLMSAGLRLGLIGQTDGQRILAALEPAIARATAAAITRNPADFGAATFAVDLASMAHETQYSRLFRS
jgi:urease accessory protein